MNFKILFFLMMISISCTDGQENVVKSPELQTEVPNSNSDSNSTEETSGNTSENSNSDSDSNSTEETSGNTSENSNSTNDSYQTTADLNKIYFIDEEIGFIAGDGVVLNTNNGGQIWTLIKEDQNINFKSIHFENETHGLVAGRGLFLTNNGGTTWEIIIPVFFGDGGLLEYVFGDNNSKNIIFFQDNPYISSNTGKDWNKLELGHRRFGISSAFKLNDKIYFLSKSSWTGGNWATSFYESYFPYEQCERIVSHCS